MFIHASKHMRDRNRDATNRHNLLNYREISVQLKYPPDFGDKKHPSRDARTRGVIEIHNFVKSM
ncbi:hypothetical protein [Neorhizobium sp. NCHU2750]|uniref:hypothetical protein n=1 Tax=Neorhizobium sp. NCHU2750 TaxID=1825976 RepID=UPI000EB69DF3|nr:hypothetical protein NCHU2750_18810 [Neorhizobium sp. NCHU2750]